MSERDRLLRFSSVRLQNWKNFKTGDVDMKGRVFLVGPNASGKSNFLDVFRFLRDLASPGGGFQQAVERRRGVKAIRCLAARDPSHIEIAVEVAPPDGSARWRYELAFGDSPQRSPRLIKEMVSRDGEVLLERPNKEDREDPERLTQTYLEQVNVNQPFRDLATFFQSTRYLHIVPQLIREPDRTVSRSNDPFGSDFLEQIAKTRVPTQKARLRRIREALQIAVPQLSEIELWHDTRGMPHLRGKYVHWRAPGAWQTEEQFSDGTLRLVGLLWAMLDDAGPLLLEEPELSLHPEVIRFLPQMFARVQRRTGRQIILSTHSSDLLRDEGIGLDEVLLLLPGKEATEIKPASDFQEIIDLLEGGLTLADAVIPRTRPERAGELPLFGEL